MGRAKDNHPDAQHGNREGRRRKQGERYFISSLPEGVGEAERVVRGHWMAERERTRKSIWSGL